MQCIVCRNWRCFGSKLFQDPKQLRVHILNFFVTETNSDLTNEKGSILLPVCSLSYHYAVVFDFDFYLYSFVQVEAFLEQTIVAFLILIPAMLVTVLWLPIRPLSANLQFHICVVCRFQSSFFKFFIRALNSHVVVLLVIAITWHFYTFRQDFSKWTNLLKCERTEKLSPRENGQSAGAFVNKLCCDYAAAGCNGRR